MDNTLLISLSKWKSLFSNFTNYPFKSVSTRAVEQVGSLQDVSVPDEGFCVLSEQEGLSFIHLTVLHHLQPLTVVPAELLSLDLLPPLLVVFLERRGGRRGSSGGRRKQRLSVHKTTSSIFYCTVWLCCVLSCLLTCSTFIHTEEISFIRHLLSEVFTIWCQSHCRLIIRAATTINSLLINHVR